MNVYHGSYVKIEEIDLSKCFPNKDFGKGFYVTKFRRHAEGWSKAIGKKHGTDGFVTEFVFFDTEFTERLCKVKHFDAYNEEWLDFVIENRNPFGVKHDFDIVEGPVADDKVQNRIENYLNGEIDKADFLEELKWHEETHQICFCTVKALLTLQRPDREGQKRVSLIAHIGELIVERLILDHGMDEQTAGDKFFSSETFAGLSDEASGLHQKPWDEIYAILLNELKLNGLFV
jgi:hypothetical protein